MYTARRKTWRFFLFTAAFFLVFCYTTGMKHMKLFIAVFATVAACLVILAHAELYYSWMYFLQISGSPLANVVRIVIGVLSVSFILSTLLVHWHENILTEKLYHVSAVWLGIMWNLTLATVALWGLWILQKVSGMDFSLVYFAYVLLIVAGTYSLYGLWNAQNPRITYITVPMNDIPRQWEGITVVQLSDIHLGAIHRYRFMERVIAKTNEVKPDVVFITGDLFDGAGQKLNHLAAPINDLHAPKGVYYITGNHETYVSLEKSLAAVRETKARILDDEVIDLEGMQILGVSYPEVGEKKDFGPIGMLLDPSRPSIVLYHEPKPTIVKLFKDAGARLMLSGHTHLGQMWPFNFITRKVYKGDDYGLHTQGDFSIYTSSGVGTWGPPMRTGNRPEIVVMKFVGK